MFVGETSGGSPNLYGDAVPVDLPSAGLNVEVAGVYWQKSYAADPRVAVEPGSRCRFARRRCSGRDPVLAAALAYR